MFEMKGATLDNNRSQNLHTMQHKYYKEHTPQTFPNRLAILSKAYQILVIAPKFDHLSHSTMDTDGKSIATHIAKMVFVHNLHIVTKVLAH